LLQRHERFGVTDLSRNTIAALAADFQVEAVCFAQSYSAGRSGLAPMENGARPERRDGKITVYVKF
jgi:hypothetical protein